MLDIPLPETTLRKLELQWRELLDARGFTGKHLTLHERERERNARIAAQTPEGSRHRQSAGSSANDYLQAGIPETVSLARFRFDQFAGEYLKRWQASDDARHDLFTPVLERIKAQTLADVGDLWCKTPDNTTWFKQTCQPQVDSELSKAVEEWASRARRLEIERLEGNDLLALTGGNVFKDKRNSERTQRVTKPAPATWKEFELRFTSDHRVQIHIGSWSEVLTYTEFGFEDKRNGKTASKPNKAWDLLCELAQTNGMLDKRKVNGSKLMATEKNMYRARKAIQKYCPKTPGNPLPCKNGIYRAAFNINCHPSFDK